ncbi:MAG TPA: alpha/beta fold hydrolase [Polyangiaceae bacterium]|nr:alpha/beta fold hydrolase [Polyangiaceae bacterium]
MRDTSRFATALRASALVGSVLLIGCGDDEGRSGRARGALAGESFVLVHGAWNGDWVWRGLERRLADEGARVRTVTLPGHSEDRTPVRETSLSAYVEHVASVLDEDERVTLVGHSFGGVVISLTAEAYASRIERLVYVGAFLPSDGDTALGLAMTDGESDLGPALVFDTERGVVGIQEELFPELFCADCSRADLQILGEKYSDEPLPPLTETITLSQGTFGKVSKYYVFTAEDRVLSPSFQRRMASGWDLRASATLETSHCPFFSAPDELVETIRNWVKP